MSASYCKYLQSKVVDQRSSLSYLVRAIGFRGQGGNLSAPTFFSKPILSKVITSHTPPTPLIFRPSNVPELNNIVRIEIFDPKF